MILTKEEQELILKHREQEEQNKPKKFGVLKEDLYVFKWIHSNYTFSVPHFTLDQKKDKMEEIENSWFKIASAGDYFDCYIEHGAECWYDRNGDLVDMIEDWAREHLKDIKNVRSKIRK